MFAAYVAVVLTIGRLASRRVRTADDFHLCGRKLGRLPAALSLAATEFSGSGLIGGAGLAYAIGIAGIYWNILAVPAWIIIGFTLALQLRKLALHTIPEFLGTHYGISTRRLVAALQILEAVVFTAVQVMVSAIALHALFGMELLTASLAVTLVFAAYTMMGGLWAVVWTDVFQYVVLMSGILIAFPLALMHVGGPAALFAALPAERWDWGALGFWEPLAWLALCVYSYSTDQTYMQRAFAAQDPQVARFAFVFTGLNYIVFAVCVAGLGLVASVLLPGLPNQDQALPQLIRDVLPPGLRAFFLTAILATTMSTASAWLAAASALAIRDLYEPLIGRSGADSDRFVLRDSRVATVVFAALACVISIAWPGVVNLVVFSTLVAPAAVFFPLLFALYCRRTDPRSALWAILLAASAGATSQAFLYGSVEGPLGAIHPLFLGPGLGLAVLVIAALRRKPVGNSGMEARVR